VNVPEPLLQLTNRGVVRLGAEDAVERLRAEFAARHAVRLPSLLAPALVSWVQREVEHGSFFEKAHGEAATELCLRDDATVGLLHLLVNDPALFQLIERLGDCAPIRGFFGRVYRHLPGGGHYHRWHGDVSDARRVGMSINLSAAPYDGGLFEIRHVGDQAALTSLENRVAGDAILFRLGDTLEHRVTEVTGHRSKTAFAGWFRREPDYRAELHAAVAGHGGRA
jgi:hypothetical protein